MIVILGDGKSPPLSVPVKIIALYDDHGVSLFGAEQLNNRHIQTGELDDADLKDILLRNGLPYKPMKDVSSDFQSVEKGRVLRISEHD